ncbi:MAG: AraC family transcriptional regulator [Rhodothermales bacterium]|nr:AraC family transcriptional regulator [Rhodothermales bacterium]MBO6780849.1 AraC family transcriptional regulator [Rhodothermales bacterium]
MSTADPFLSLWAILFSFCALQGFVLAGILSFNPGRQPAANRFLAAVALLIAVITTGYVVQTSGLNRSLSGLGFLLGPFWLLLGPALYAYLWLLTGHSLRLSWRVALQLVPFLVYLVPTLHSTFWPQHFAALGYGKYLYLSQAGGLRFFPLLYTYLFTMQMIVYLGLSVRLLRRFERAHRERSSDHIAQYLLWFRRLVTVFLAYMAYETVFSLRLLVTGTAEVHYYYISALFISSFLLLIIYTAFRNPQVFQSPPLHGRKYDRSALPEPYVEQNLAKLMELMEEEKPHLRSDLKLSDLADMLGISRHHVTQLLNQQVGKSFHAFINAYRVEEACRRLTDPSYRDFSVLAIAHDVGFNSKTSFNRIFKRHTQMTPSQYARVRAR